MFRDHYGNHSIPNGSWTCFFWLYSGQSEPDRYRAYIFFSFHESNIIETLLLFLLSLNLLGKWVAIKIPIKPVSHKKLWLIGTLCGIGTSYVSLPPSLLTVDDHLEAGGAGSPREVQLAVGQTGAVLNDGRLPGVELRSGAVEPHHPTVPHHHQTHPTDLPGSRFKWEKSARVTGKVRQVTWTFNLDLIRNGLCLNACSPTWWRPSSSSVCSWGKTSIHKLSKVNRFTFDNLGPWPERRNNWSKSHLIIPVTLGYVCIQRKTRVTVLIHNPTSILFKPQTQSAWLHYREDSINQR